MSDPQPAHLKKQPPRAEPLQPDAPAQGDGAHDDSEGENHVKAEEALEEQQETAHKNTREGYE